MEHTEIQAGWVSRTDRSSAEAVETRSSSEESIRRTSTGSQVKLSFDEPARGDERNQRSRPPLSGSSERMPPKL